MRVSSAEPEALSRSLKCVQRTVRSGAADGPPDIKKNLPEPDGTESGWRCVQRTVRGLSADSPVSWIFVTADGPPMYCGRSAVPFSAGPGQLGQTNRSDQLVAPIDRLAPPTSIIQNRFEALHSALCHD